LRTIPAKTGNRTCPIVDRSETESGASEKSGWPRLGPTLVPQARDLHPGSGTGTNVINSLGPNSRFNVLS